MNMEILRRKIGVLRAKSDGAHVGTPEPPGGLSDEHDVRKVRNRTSQQSRVVPAFTQEISIDYP